MAIHKHAIGFLKGKNAGGSRGSIVWVYLWWRHEVNGLNVPIHGKICKGD